MISNVDKHQ